MRNYSEKDDFVPQTFSLIMKMTAFLSDIYGHCVRAPTVNVGYVPNAKYLAHIPHQTGKSAPHEILQML